ncbi:A24 family peptidase C-terminal domain-containing protein [Methanotorris igneus]|uniref:Peptidase A24A domain protein n=1 Tax=Methanotorris igneus (strain DSM 5666 / JCM 11834 / Kol 5) TaxID=880724 RepID=F6BDF8_METIK|nr:A24 family peptidase C-terminal domain-containing protein [Methanotorris igneus]AEF96519.1 Peptidase A24A domain protein [Methanotorris igneus Kol 5]
MLFLSIAYVVNAILLLLASLTDIKERIIPHKYVIAMLILNLTVGYYYFGTDAIIAFFSTLILCLILSVGMGGGDVKVFSALAPLFAFDLVYYFPKYILVLIGLSAGLAVFFPMLKILKVYWRDILPSSLYLATVLGILVYITQIYNIPYATIVVWGYIILSIILSKKIPNYKEITKKLGFLFPIYLVGLYFVDTNYFISNNVFLSSLIYVGELTLISIVIYALMGAEVSDKKAIGELKEGDILRDIIVLKDNGDVVVENANLIKRIKFLIDYEKGGKKDYKLIFTDGEGLSEETIKLLKELHKNGKIPNELNVLKTYPFIPFVFLAYLIILIIMYKMNVGYYVI